MTNQIIPIENPNLPDMFAHGGLADILNRIESEARSIVPDVSTAKGRKEIASVAQRVARSKTYLDGLGKDFVSGLKKQTAAVDAERKTARDRLDALKAEVRRPLTEWEQAEADRVARHEQAINALVGYQSGHDGLDAKTLGEMLVAVEAIDMSEAAWQEFHEQAQAEYRRAIDSLTSAIVRREQYEQEQAELTRLRAEAAEREAKEAADRAASEQKEREERIAREAEDRARREADQRAKAEAERRERERIDAERRIAEAEERARIAAEQERARAEQEKARERAEAERRAADLEHRRAINLAAKSALVDHAGLSAIDAERAVACIAKGQVPSVEVRY